MDRFHEMQVFVAVAEAGGFARAAERLHLSPPAVTRAVSALEERLGARVFNRTTRSLSLTDAGHRFLDNARRLLDDLDTVEKDVIGEAAEPRGRLTLTASVTFGRMALFPVVNRFLDAYPDVSANVLLLDRVANLVEEGIDVGVRIAHLEDSTLIARKVGEVRRILVASPRYLKRAGVPDAPGALRQHRLIAMNSLTRNREWRFADGGRTRTLNHDARLEVNDAAAAIEAAANGDGITGVLSYMVADRLRQGTLVEVLAPFSLPAVPVHLVYPESRIVAPKIRAFVDFAAPRLKAALEGYAAPEGTA